MNCLYITLFFDIVAGIVQTFIKSWNQLLYPRVIEVCRLSFVRREHQSFLRRIHGTTSSHFAYSLRYHKQQQSVCEFPLDVHLLRWEIIWRNAPRLWRDFGSALDCSPAYLSTQNARTHTKCYAAASPHWLFTFLTNFKISDFNKEHTSSLKMVWMMIETCWSVFKCFTVNILD